MGQKKSIWSLVMKAAGVEEKLSKLTGLSDRVSEGFSNTQERIGAAQNRLKGFISEVPFLGRAYEFATNPIVAFGSALLFTLGVMGQGVHSAAEFENQFLEIKQLNLDKSVKELERLNQATLNTAFSAGLSGTETAKAYFDIQSATGKYGKEVLTMVGRIGQFSNITKSNLDSLTNSVSKAAGLFNVNADNIDAYLASMAKTVQVGITTYDQLAQIQADYLGAAAAAGQGFDEGNKIFAAMTKVSKSTAEAATLTKTAFQGMIDPNVQKGLKKWGVDVFDASGKMKGMDTIATDLQGKLGAMSDQTFSNFMGDVGGPEGMRSFMNLLKTQGDQVLQTFKQFDETKFDINKAIKNAHGDFTQLKQLVSNRLNVVMIKLGQIILPTVIRALQWFNNVIQSVFGWFQNNKGWLIDFWDALTTSVKVYVGIMAVLNAKIILMTIVTKAYTIAQWLLNIAMNANPVGLIILGVSALIGGITMLWKRSEGFRGTLTGLWEGMKQFGTTIKNYVVNRLQEMLSGITGIGKALWAFFTGNWKEAWEEGKKAVKNLTGIGADSMNQAFKDGSEIGNRFEEGYNSGAQKVRDNKLNKNDSKNDSALSDFYDPKLSTDPVTPVTDDPIRKGADSIAGGGKTVRNITITIEKQIESLVLQVQDVKEGTSEIREIIQEELIKLIRGTEIASSS